MTGMSALFNGTNPLTNQPGAATTAAGTVGALTNGLGALTAAGYSYGAGTAQAAATLPLANQVANPYIAATNPMQAALNSQQAAIAAQQQNYQQQAQQELTDANNQAQVLAFNGSQQSAATAQAYTNNGVMLAGSPLLAVDQVRQLTQNQITATLGRGQNLANLSMANAYAAGQNGQASLFGDQSQFITNQADQKVQAGNNAQVLRQAAFNAQNTANASGANLLGNAVGTGLTWLTT